MFALVLFVLVFLLHTLLLVGAKEIPEKQKQIRVEMALVKPPPPPPPPEPVEEKKPEPKKKKPKKRRPPPPNQEPPPEPQAEPPPIVTGISMNSTVKSSGFNVRVGNTTYGDMNKEDFVDPSKVKGYRWEPVRGSKLSRQAKVKKEVKPKYPIQAVEAEIGIIPSLL